MKKAYFSRFIDIKKLCNLHNEQHKTLCKLSIVKSKYYDIMVSELRKERKNNMKGRGFTTSIITEWNEWVHSIVQELATKLGNRYLLLHTFDPETMEERIIAKQKDYAVEYSIPITRYVEDFKKNKDKEKEKIISFFVQAVKGF